MQLNEVLRQIGGIGAMARELGVSETQAASGAEALLPAILGGFKWQARAHPTGIDGPGAGLQQLGGGDLSEEVLAPQPTDLGWGNDVLGQIFGTPDVSRKVAQHAAAQSGLDASVLKKMLPLLPLLAMLVGGFIARQHDAGQSAPSAQGSGSGLDALLGGLLGGGVVGSRTAPSPLAGLGSLLDLDGDGILKMADSARR
ncbi:MAG: DUF937 domain-containing protein [Betaproteobacteria bacterium]|nr:DUF937 domain-containing protein [Betaproteobacteria bacterium]